ncbi:MAG: hypothetical protein ACO3A2_06055 [Bdellovibrionia bacterium]
MDVGFILVKIEKKITHELRASSVDKRVMLGEIKKRALILVLAGWGLLPQGAHGRDDVIPGSRYVSARGDALGDALIAVGDDLASGLFYNPAQLSRIRLFEYELLNWSGTVNLNLLKTFNLGTPEAGFPGSLLPSISTLTDQYVGGGGSAFMGVGMRGLALGVLVDTQFASRLNSDQTVSYRSRYQLIPAMGWGFQLFRGILRVGYSLQVVGVAQNSGTTQGTTSFSYLDGALQGTTLSSTFGLSMVLPVSGSPGFHAVARNAFPTEYSPNVLYRFTNSPSGVPATDVTTFDAAFSLRPHFGRNAALNLLAQLRDATNTSVTSLDQRMAYGAELSFRNWLFFRGGLRGRHLSAGLGFKRAKSELSFAYSTVDVGTSQSSVADSRLMVQFQIRGF